MCRIHNLMCPYLSLIKFRGKSGRGLYGDVIMEIDWSVGQILNALKANNLDENTVVIFTSDNGPWLSYGNHAGSAIPFREGKGTAWEGGHREPFIIRYPTGLKGGRTIDAASNGYRYFTYPSSYNRFKIT